MRYRQHPMASATVISGEAAVITPSDSRLHVLDETGTLIWEACAGPQGADLTELVSILREHFEGPWDVIAEETEIFLSHLVKLGALDRVREEAG
jgi:hypothetical protein